MNFMKSRLLLLSTTILTGILVSTLYACKDETPTVASSTAVEATFNGNIDLNNLLNYEGQGKPAYITRDNTVGHPVTNRGATLGRVLFYDVNLSVNNTISCGSCHKQKFAFGDTAAASQGVNGVTGRHSMRLINSRFSADPKFFWDERALTLESQTTRPIQDHKEMGFSGTGGDPALSDLITKVEAIGYYQELFKFVYGDAEITEQRMQNALSQFVRSIQSFDSKYDAGRARVLNDGPPFPNFTAEENQGKQLFLVPPQFDAGGNRIAGGAGCQGCHHAPEFDIEPNSKNNGVVGVIGSAAIDITNTRSPSLRDLMNVDGTLNNQAMHDASKVTLQAVLDHYNAIPLVFGNTNLDPKLRPGGQLQKLQLTVAEKNALTAFIKTLSGTTVYTDVRWSDPF